MIEKLLTDLEPVEKFLKIILLIVGLLYVIFILFLCYWLFYTYDKNSELGKSDNGKSVVLKKGITPFKLLSLIVVSFVGLGLTIGLGRSVVRHDAKCIKIYFGILLTFFVANLVTTVYFYIINGVKGSYWILIIVGFAADGYFLYQIHVYAKLITELKDLKHVFHPEDYNLNDQN